MGTKTAQRGSLRGQILLALAAMTFPLIGVGALSMWGIQATTSAFQEAAEEQIAESLVVIRLRDGLITSEWWAMQYSNEGMPEAKSEFLQLVPAIDADVERILGMDHPTELTMARQIADGWGVAREVGLRAMDLPAGAAETAPQYPLEEFHPAIEEGVGLLVDLNRASLDDMESTVGRIEGNGDTLLIVLGLGLLLAFVLAVLMSKRLRRILLLPLKRLELATLRFGEHDFEHRVDIRAGGELASVGDAFNTMADRISSTQRAAENLQEQLRHQALHDPLTGLANRTLLYDRLDHALTRMARTGLPVGLLYLDVDDFKSVNDNHGHDAGDQILVAMAERFRKCLRASDTAGRMGGDEFAIVLEVLSAPDDASLIADRILAAMRPPIVVGDVELEVHVSIGLSTTGAGSDSAQGLLQQADVALYAAKSKGKGGVVVYDGSIDEDAHGKERLRSQLAGAIAEDQLRAVFQPMVRLETGQMIGAEALLRWMHPEEGLLAPERFLSIAEETGIVHELDAWILREACRHAVVWRDQAPEEFTINVNVSGRTLEREDIVGRVAATLEETGLPPEQLVLEITENVLVQSSAVWRLASLKKLGVRLAVDDFGTGYSSLNYLKQFPVDYLKIDRSFIEDVGEDPRAYDLTHAMVRMADALRLGVVAEGIERESQMRCLADFGVSQGQGFLLSRPVEPDAIQHLLHQRLTGEVLEQLASAPGRG